MEHVAPYLLELEIERLQLKISSCFNQEARRTHEARLKQLKYNRIVKMFQDAKPGDRNVYIHYR